MNARRTAYTVMGLVLGGLMVLAIHPVSRFYPVCPVYAYFHVLCPGCGATRSLAALLRGDLDTAWRMNALFLLALPLLAAYGTRTFWRAVQPGPFTWPRTSSGVLCLGAALMLAFTVGRN